MSDPANNTTSYNQEIVVPANGCISPMDQYNRALLENVHPSDWVNPEPDGTYNLVVIGAGPAGLVTAAGAAGVGAKVALVEQHLMGGDCTNVGCVPSKCMIRSARAAAAVRRAGDFGVRVPFNLLNYAFGLTRVSLKHYFFASWVGMIPGTIMYVYIGSLAGDLARLGTGQRTRTTGEWVLYGVGLLAAIGVTVFVTRMARKALAPRIA